METQLVETDRIFVRPINKQTARKMIVANHYSHAWSLCTYALGIFYRYDTDHKFLEDKEEELIGCLVYGNPVGRSAIKAISDNIELDECLELVRLFVFDNWGRNVESRSIGLSFEWLKRNAPKIKMLISYSDPEQGHLGKIYQATNWLYQGCGEMNIMSNYSISLTKDPYNWIHSRSVFELFGSHNLEHLRKMIGHTFWRKQEPFKHRYIYFLCNRKEKKAILKNMKHPFLPYPKDASQFETPIEEHFVEEKKTETAFW